MEKEIPFVSIIVPTHNRRELLKDTIESLFSQSYPKDRYEIIVIDNESMDGTNEIMQSLEGTSPCVFTYKRKADEGPGISRNIGISMARGSIVAFTEDDCVADKDWLKNGVVKMSDGIGLVQGKTLPKDNQPLTEFTHTGINKSENGIYQTFNMFYRKSILDQVGGLSTEFIGLERFGRPAFGGEDIDLAWKIKKMGWKSCFADDAVVYHHVFQVNPWKYVLKHRIFQSFYYVLPVIVKKYPELRKMLLYRKIFWSKYNAVVALCLVSVGLGIIIHKGFFLIALLSVWPLIRDIFSGRQLRTYPRGFIVVIALFYVHTVLFILLLAGSIRYRSLVL
jgi:glycosyltransferase involved in cell wall biosynthesis